MLPARPARHIAMVVHTMMPVSELLIGSPKRWNTEILENYVSPKDISIFGHDTIEMNIAEAIKERYVHG